ncbi:MAG: hypothetical protein LBI05_12020 [Planctomycetaceae bacterium]|jgi:hypothetical protein|nr:hypothetical protein [Planctomycetaceae bacterium]
MIKDNFRKGDPQPGHKWNNDVAKEVNRAAEERRARNNSVAGNNSVLSGQLSINIRNGTGRFLPRLSVVSVSSPVGQDGWAGRIGANNDIRNFVLNEGILYNGLIPGDSDSWTPAITLVDLYPNEIGKVVIMGITPCLVGIQSPEHEFVDVVPGSTEMLQTVESGRIRLVRQSIPRGMNTGRHVVDVLLGFSAGGGSGGGEYVPPGQGATVILPICRAINPQAKADLGIPSDKTYQSEHNSRKHYAAQMGFIAIDGKEYQPLVSHVDENGVTHYCKNLRVSCDVSLPTIKNTNAHYRTASSNRSNVLQRPIIVYAEEDGAEWKIWESDFEWETTTDPTLAFRNYDYAACPTLDYSEVLVPGERVKTIRDETHEFYWENVDNAVSINVAIVEPPKTYSVEFEGTASVIEFGIWNKERMISNNQGDVVHSTIDADFNIGSGESPYDYWGFDTVDLLPNGDVSWSFIKIAAFPKLGTIQGNSNDIDGSHVSRPLLRDTLNISNSACNTHAYGLWDKTDRDGIRYPILCNVESLTSGTSIETRKANCMRSVFEDKEGNEKEKCEQVYHVLKFTIERKEDRLVLPDVYCAVNCAGSNSNEEVVTP